MKAGKPSSDLHSLWKPFLLLLFCQNTGNVCANPITYINPKYENTLSTAWCYGHAEVVIGVTEQVYLSTDYLAGDNGSLLPGCVVSYRVAVQNPGIEKFGIEVAGKVELEDPYNDELCASSFVYITEKDHESDVTAVSYQTCGSKEILYETYQDSVIVVLNVSASGAEGPGFAVTFTPVYVCGGTIVGPVGTKTTIQTPKFPEPYPRDMCCLWDVETDDGCAMNVFCDQFLLAERVRGTCKDYLLTQAAGIFRSYCGTELLGAEKALTINSSVVLFYFRSSARLNLAPGFVCDVTFLPALQ